MSVFNFTNWLFRNKWWMVYAVRVVTASAATLLAVYILGLKVELSAVISAVVVTQSNIGGSLTKAFEQCAGSLIGAAYATCVILVIQPMDLLMNGISLAVALAPMAVLAAFSIGFQIAPVTAVIVILGAPEPGAGPYILASERLLSVILGCGIGLLISMLVLPVRASRSVVETGSRLADLLADQLKAIAPGDGTGEEALIARTSDVRRTLLELESLVQDAVSERRVSFGRAPDGQRLLRVLKRVRHDVDLLRRAARGAGDDALYADAGGSWRHAALSGAETLRNVSRILSGTEVQENINTLVPAARGYRATLDEMRKTGVTVTLSTDALSRLFGLGHALSQLQRDLDDLIAASLQITSSRARAP